MLCCTRNSGDPETTLQSLERIDDGSTRLGHAASILWASADGQDPAATSCIVLDRTECRCLSHSVRGRRYGRCFRHMVEGRRSMQVILRTNAVSCRAMPGAGVRGMGAITASAGPDMGVFTKKGPADSFWKRWLPPRDEGLVGPWHRVQVMRARDGFCDGERDAGSGGDARRSSTCIVIREGRGGRAQRRSTARHRTALGDRVLRRREEILWLSLGIAQRRRRCGAGGSSFVRLLVGTAWCRRCGAACPIRAPGTKEAVSKTQPGTGRGLFA